MNDLKNPDSELSLKINRATDIYILKKEDLIKFCEEKKLNSTGNTSDLRSRLSRYIKGAIGLGDVKNSLTEEERIEILNKSRVEKIDLDKLSKEANLPASSPEPHREVPDNSLNNSIKFLDELNNSAISVANKIDNILESTKTIFPENPINNWDIETLIEFDIPDDKQTFDNNKPNTNIFSNNSYNPYKMDTNKFMIIKPECFSGHDDVKQFLKQYEKAALINSWNDNDKIRFLSIFLKDTASTFLENLENKKDKWTWDELKLEFLTEFQPIGYTILLKNKLENRRQSDLESITSFVTDIENLCRQVNRNMKEDDICTYILKGIKESILHAISLHDNSDLDKLKNNLKKYELMQFRINSRGSNISEYNEILNKQIMKLDINAKNKKEELDELRAKFDQLEKKMNIINISNKSVKFDVDKERDQERRNYYSERRENRDRSYSRERNDMPYREKSPYSGRSDSRSRERSFDRYNNNNRNRPYYKERKDNQYTVIKDRSYDRNSRTEERRSRGNYENYRNRSRDNSRDLKTYSRDNSRDNRFPNKTNYDSNNYKRENSRDKTPERFNRDNSYERDSRYITCYKCKEKGHYADKCNNQKNG